MDRSSAQPPSTCRIRSAAPCRTRRRASSAVPGTSLQHASSAPCSLPMLLNRRQGAKLQERLGEAYQRPRRKRWISSPPWIRRRPIKSRTTLPSRLGRQLLLPDKMSTPGELPHRRAGSAGQRLGHRDCHLSGARGSAPTRRSWPHLRAPHPPAERHEAFGLSPPRPRRRTPTAFKAAGSTTCPGRNLRTSKPRHRPCRARRTRIRCFRRTLMTR